MCNAKILLVSNEMSYTGAPIALLQMARILIRNNYDVSVASLVMGNFTKEFDNINVEVQYLDQNNLKNYKNYFKQFDLIILSTIVCYRIYKYARKYTSTVLLVTEAQQWLPYCYDRNLDILLKSSKRFYCVSEYAAEIFYKEFNVKLKILHNAIEDCYKDDKKYCKDGKFNFLVMGTIAKEKGFHTVVDAVKILPEKCRQKIHITFAGRLIDAYKNYSDKLLQDIDNLSCIEYIGEITNNEDKIQLYQNTDIIIVPSVDESCSLVALEGAMMSCALILTNNVGAKYIVNKRNGFLFKMGNEKELANIIRNIVEKNVDIKKMGKFAREEYLNTSTIEIYEKNILKMVHNNLNRSHNFEIIAYRVAKICSTIFSIRKNRVHIEIKLFGVKLKIRID